MSRPITPPIAVVSLYRDESGAFGTWLECGDKTSHSSFVQWPDVASALQRAAEVIAEHLASPTVALRAPLPDVSTDSKERP